MTKSTVNETERMVVTRVFDAPRELVWKAWTDPNSLTRAGLANFEPPALSPPSGRYSADESRIERLIFVPGS